MIIKNERKKTGINPDKNKPENAPKYEGAEAIVFKRVKKIKQTAGTCLTIEEISERLGHPVLRKHFENMMRREHPELFENRDKEAERREKIARIRMNKEMYRRGLLKEDAEKENTNEAVKTPEVAQKPRKPRLKRSMELRSTKKKPKTKQRSAELAKNAALVNKRKRAVA